MVIEKAVPKGLSPWQCDQVRQTGQPDQESLTYAKEQLIRNNLKRFQIYLNLFLEQCSVNKTTKNAQVHELGTAHNLCGIKRKRSKEPKADGNSTVSTWKASSKRL